jgi:hypothetical protein
VNPQNHFLPAVSVILGLWGKWFSSAAINIRLRKSAMVIQSAYCSNRKKGKVNQFPFSTNLNIFDYKIILLV